MRGLVTHADIDRLKSELTFRLGGMIVAGFVVTTAIVGIAIILN